jgi:microcystin-dependent protein
MAEKISDSKGFDNPVFDTYVPELEEGADIRDALELFFYGNSEDGNATGDASLYETLIDFDTRISQNDSSFDGHVGAISDVHGVGSGSEVVGTIKAQTLTNKTLTTPKINENVNLTVTSTALNYVTGVTSPIQTQINTNTPVGMISIHAGTTAPTGWLLCDGVSYSTTTYANLHSVVGYQFGGSGASFNVPNLKGRVVVGIDASQTEFDVRGESGGTMTHEHTIAQSNAISSSNHDGHTHSVNSHSHTNTAANNGGGAHNHGVTVENNNAGSHGHGDNIATANAGSHSHTTGVSSANDNAATGSGTRAISNHQHITSNTGSHSHTVNGSVSAGGTHAHSNTASTNGGGDHNHGITVTNNVANTNANTGGSHSHTTTVPQHSTNILSNLQPYMALNYIIKH